MNINEINLQPDPRNVSLNASQQVYITVVIGNAQVGGNHVSKNGVELIKGDFSTPHLLGNSSDLRGVVAKVQTGVLDVNPFTDNCVITTSFSDENGNVLFEKTDTGTAPTSGVAQFLANYLFQ